MPLLPISNMESVVGVLEYRRGLNARSMNIEHACALPLCYTPPFRSLYEGFSLSFLTELDRGSHMLLKELLEKYIVGGKDSTKVSTIL